MRWFVFAILAVVPTLTSATPIVFALADGRFCVDNGLDDDGLFNNGCGGPNYTFNADNRPSIFPEFPRRMRTGLEFGLSGLEGMKILSATLSITFGISRDLTLPGFPPPQSELLGYAGDGVVTPDDLLADNLILGFAPPPDTTLDLDVTDFVRDLLHDSASFAGFVFRIADDFDPGTFSDVQLLGEFPQNPNPATEPRLTVRVPEPPSLALLALGLLGIGRRFGYRR